MKKRKKSLLSKIKKALATRKVNQELERRRQHNKEQLVEIYKGLEVRGC